MSLLNLSFENSTNKVVTIQIDPFASLYELKKGERLEIEAEAMATKPRVTIDEYDDIRIVTLVDYDDFYIVRGNDRIHWTRDASGPSEA